MNAYMFHSFLGSTQSSDFYQIAPTLQFRTSAHIAKKLAQLSACKKHPVRCKVSDKYEK